VESGDRTAAAHDVDLVPGADIPDIRFVECAIALRFESGDRFGDGVKGGGGGVDVFE
jgi:hypothetical protein